jgi:uncharacterized RDD family membrane protein YckC
MSTMQCETCGHVNAGAAERCARCAAPLPADAALAPGAPVATAAPLGAPAPSSPPPCVGEDVPEGAAIGAHVGEDDAERVAIRERASEDDAERAAIHDLRAHWQARAGVAAPARYAGFALRLIAFLIDGAILGIFALPLALAGFAGVRAGLLVMRVPTPVEAEDALTSLLSFGWLAMATIYFTALHTGAGQTIGKALLGIRVRSVRNLAAIGPLRSLVRALGYVASSSFFGLGFLMVALTPQKRAWHDYLAGTCVVRLAPDEA